MVTTLVDLIDLVQQFDSRRPVVQVAMDEPLIERGRGDECNHGSGDRDEQSPPGERFSGRQPS